MTLHSVFLMIYWVAQVHSSPDSLKISWSAELGITSIASIEAALSGPLEKNNEWEVLLGNGEKRQVKSCNDLLAVSQLTFDVSTEQDWGLIKSAGARCLALLALKSANIPSKTYLNWFHFSATNITKLSPRLDMCLSQDSVQAATKAERTCTSWGKYDGALKARMLTIDRAQVSTGEDGWRGEIILYGRADFDGDGVEDLLIRRDAYVEGGSASDASIFIVTQTTKKRCLKVIQTMRVPAE
jgi:hypothetical protein